MLIGYKRGQTGIVLRVKILNSSVATGAGLTGLTSASSGLIISTIADNESSATAYTAAGSTIEAITTLGTYAAPTATKVRFKEVDATNHKGVYEIQIADARYAVSSAKSLLVSISGATNAAETDVVIPLRDLDPYDSVRAGLTALPNAAASASGGLVVIGTGSNTFKSDASANVTVGGYATGQAPLQPTTAGRTLDVTATGEAGIDWANIGGATTAVNLSGTTINLVNTATTLTNAPADSSGTTTLLSRLTSTRAGNLDNLDAAITTRLAPTTAGRTLDVSATGEAGVDWANVGGQTTAVTLSATTVNLVNTATTLTNAPSDSSGVTTLLTRLSSTRAGYLDNLSAGAVALASSQTTIAGHLTDIKGASWASGEDLHTLFASYTAARAAKLDNLDATVGSRLSSAGYTAPPTAAAVADAVWDEAQSGHTTAGTFGKYLDAAISGVGGATGAGADQCTVNVKVGGVNVADADVWVSTDSAGDVVVAGPLQTDSAGNVTFLLDAGVTYYLWMEKDGVNPIRGQSFTAVAD